MDANGGFALGLSAASQMGDEVERRKTLLSNPIRAVSQIICLVVLLPLPAPSPQIQVLSDSSPTRDLGMRFVNIPFAILKREAG